MCVLVLLYYSVFLYFRLVKLEIRMPAHRARLPASIRRKIQKGVRRFVFFALSFVTVYEGYRNVNLFLQYGDVMRGFGFV